MSIRTLPPKGRARTAVIEKPELDLRARRYSPSERSTILSAAEHLSAKKLREQFGVCRETVRRWQRRDLQASENHDLSGSSDSSEEGLRQERSDSPISGHYGGYHPNWKEVLHLWRSRPGLGPAQIRNQLFRQGKRITVTTVSKIMDENGYTPP